MSGKYLRFPAIPPKFGDDFDTNLIITDLNRMSANVCQTFQIQRITEIKTNKILKLLTLKRCRTRQTLQISLNCKMLFNFFKKRLRQRGKRTFQSVVYLRYSELSRCLPTKPSQRPAQPLLHPYTHLGLASSHGCGSATRIAGRRRSQLGRSPG